VDVSPNVRIVDPVVTQLITSDLVPNSVELAHEALFAPVRTALDQHGPGSLRRSLLYSMLHIIRWLIPSMSSTVDESTRESRARAGVRWRDCRPEIGGGVAGTPPSSRAAPPEAPFSSPARRHRNWLPAT
jgi:hypothetical protein